MRPAYITARTEWKGSSCSVVVKNHPQGKLARVITERRHESATSAIPSRFFPGKRLCARGAPHPGVCQRNLGKVKQALPSALLSFLVPRFHKRRIPFNAVSISAQSANADFQDASQRGSRAGGDSVTITGTGFTGATGVGFGATGATKPLVGDSSVLSSQPGPGPLLALRLV
jgi:hypothetical protein